MATRVWLTCRLMAKIVEASAMPWSCSDCTSPFCSADGDNVVSMAGATLSRSSAFPTWDPPDRVHKALQSWAERPTQSRLACSVLACSMLTGACHSGYLLENTGA